MPKDWISAGREYSLTLTVRSSPNLTLVGGHAV